MSRVMRLSMLIPARMPANSGNVGEGGAICDMEWRQPHSGAAHRVDRVLEFLKLRSRERLAWFVR